MYMQSREMTEVVGSVPRMWTRAIISPPSLSFLSCKIGIIEPPIRVVYGRCHTGSSPVPQWLVLGRLRMWTHLGAVTLPPFQFSGSLDRSEQGSGEEFWGNL